MIGKVKLVVIETAVKVEYREGVQTCIFCTEKDQEVLFQRDKQGQIVKITDISIDCFSAAAARALIAKEKLLDNPIIEKGPHHTLKKVDAKPFVVSNQLSRQQLIHDAWCHALRMNPWDEDKD
jgi:phosphoribosylformylglycinamidine (FGAM) synthase PurS component